MTGFRDAGGEDVEILPLVVVARTFPARPASLPDIREFVRRRLTEVPFTEDDLRRLGERVAELLLDAAGPDGAIQVSLRIFPDRSEVDVLQVSTAEDPGPAGTPAREGRRAPGSEVPAGTPHDTAGTLDPATGPETAGGPGPARGPAVVGGSAGREAGASFAEWLAGALRQRGMTMEAAGRQLGVSVKTVSRWVAGSTEPRLRDLARIREVFGELPFP